MTFCEYCQKDYKRYDSHMKKKHYLILPKDIDVPDNVKNLLSGFNQLLETPLMKEIAKIEHENPDKEIDPEELMRMAEERLKIEHTPITPNMLLNLNQQT